MSATELSEKIQAFQAEIIPTIPEDTLNMMMAELQTLIASGLAESAKKTGDLLPAFNLPNANNEPLDSDSLLSNGPLVISFYRGAWCPYCNLEINALQQRLADINAAGAQLIAISPQTPDKSLDQLNRSQLNFEILSDIGNKLAKECGLVFTLPQPLRPVYEAWQIDIPGHNADDSFELPIPATYIIDQTGKIRYAHVDMDYTKRLEPEIIIEQLKVL